ncbi:MAG: hypothetical protein ACRDHX_05990 [Chloroflexota bacterium]
MGKRLAALRIALVLEGLTFLVAAALNFGARVPLGFTILAFPLRILPVGVVEAVIGGTLLAGAMTLRRGMAWLGFWLAAGGIAFGLVATAARGGPEREVHLILVPLALNTLGLLIWTNRPASGDRTNVVRYTGSAGMLRLMLVTAGTLIAASLVHFGVGAPLGLTDPFQAAAVPELVLGLLLALGTAFLITGRPGGREMAVAVAVFTLLLSAYGFYTTLRTVRTGDIAYHIVLIVLLVGIIAGLCISSPATHRQPARQPE